jgi:aldose 1-epimerase
LQLTTAWTLGPDGIRAEHTATNLSGTPCPFGLGTHPYISLPGTVDDLELRLPARNRLLVDARMLPIGAARVAGGDFDFHAGRRIGDAHLDTAFGEVPAGGSTVTLSTVEGAGVEVWAEEAFAWWQVYTGDTLPAARNRRSVAIEPMTCPPDAFNSGRDLVTLKPGDTWRGAWGIRPRNGR